MALLAAKSLNFPPLESFAYTYPAPFILELPHAGVSWRGTSHFAEDIRSCKWYAVRIESRAKVREHLPSGARLARGIRGHMESLDPAFHAGDCFLPSQQSSQSAVQRGRVARWA